MNPSTITAVVPAAGLGKRLRPHTFTAPKGLLPVAGKPILGYILDILKASGIRKVVLVIGYLGDQIEEYVRKTYDFETIFVEQKEFLGLGYAVNLAREHVTGPVLIILGDTIIEADIPSFLKSGTSWIGVKEVEDPRRFGVVEVGPDGYITRLVEKPSTFVSRKAIVGVYHLVESGLLFDCLSANIKNGIMTAKEFQLTDGLQLMIEKGARMTAVPIADWYDCGKVETLLETNRFLLGKANPPVPSLAGVVFNDYVSVGRDVKLVNCVIGPHVSIGNGVEMENVVIRDAIVNDEAVVKNVVVDGSVIGRGAVMVGGRRRINLGDYSEILLSE